MKCRNGWCQEVAIPGGKRCVEHAKARTERQRRSAEAEKRRAEMPCCSTCGYQNTLVEGTDECWKCRNEREDREFTANRDAEIDEMLMWFRNAKAEGRI